MCRVGHAFFVQRLVQAGDVFGVDAGDRSGLRGKTVHPTPDTFQRGCDPSFKFRDLLHRLSPFLSSKSRQGPQSESPQTVLKLILAQCCGADRPFPNNSLPRVLDLAA